VEHERDSLARSQPVEHDVEGNTHSVGERDVVGRVGDRLARADVVHGDWCARAQPVEAQTGGHGGQPGRKAVDLGVGHVQPQPRLLHDVLGLGVVAEHPAREPHQAWSLGFESLGLVHGPHPFTFVVQPTDARDQQSVTAS
jgi:hypothetical protein